jgi:rhodanese-related sulfurtransferase
MSNNKVKSEKILGCFVAIILSLSFAATLPSSAMAQETSGYTNITATQAYDIIEHNSSPNLLVLDVRNQSEYTFIHLYNALQIPCYLLEDLIDVYQANPDAPIMDWRIIKLLTSIDAPVIVYCAKGSRSEIACGILAEKGFSQVYNVIGGIEAWIQADLPCYNTAHTVTIENNDEKDPVVTIDPLLLSPCTTCGQNNSPNDGILQNLDFEMIDQTENFTQAHIIFDYNDTTFDNTVSITTLWKYIDSDELSNITATLTSINSVGSLSSQYYQLQYQIQDYRYNFSVITNLEPLGTNGYNASSTIVKFLPIGKTQMQSVELVDFTSPVTLSQLYSSLELASKRIAANYQSEGGKYKDGTLTNLAESYRQMAKGLKDLSKIVKLELQDYDKEILHNSVVLTDDACFDCQFACSIVLGLLQAGHDVLAVQLVCLFLVAAAGIGFVICEAVVIIIALIGWAYLSLVTCNEVCQEYCNPAPPPPVTTHIGYVYSATPYSNGVIDSADNVVGAPDNAFAHITQGGGTIDSVMSASCHGSVTLRAGFPASTHFYVYVSVNNNYDWVCICNTVYGICYPTDLNLGYVSSDFNYIAIAAYDSSLPSNMYIDSVTVTS